MTSEVSLTGPGLQLHYRVFNLSDREFWTHNDSDDLTAESWVMVLLGFTFLKCVAQLVPVSSCAPLTACVFLPVMESRTVPTGSMRGTAVLVLLF